VIGILPITGVPLPFVSYGGSSLVFSMLGAGLLLNVARQGQVPAGPTRVDGRRAHATEHR
jgi:cell division protein FtsW